MNLRKTTSCVSLFLSLLLIFSQVPFSHAISSDVLKRKKAINHQQLSPKAQNKTSQESQPAPPEQVLPQYGYQQEINQKSEPKSLGNSHKNEGGSERDSQNSASQKEKLTQIYQEILEQKRNGGVIDESELKAKLTQENLSLDYAVSFIKSFAKKINNQEKKLKVKKSTIPGYLLQPRLGGNFKAQGLSSNEEPTAATQAVEYVDERIMVRSLRYLTDEEMKQIGQQTNTIIRRLQHNPFHLYRIDGERGQTAVELLQTFHGMPFTHWVEPDYVFRAQAVPNDPLYAANQWQHNNTGGDYHAYNQGLTVAGTDMQSEDAWDIFTGSGDTILAVIDSGVHIYHEDLIGNLWDGSAGCVDQNGIAIPDGCPFHGWDFFETFFNDGIIADNFPDDYTSHGTQVAGMAAARGNNNLGITGVNWKGNIMALKNSGAGSIFFSSQALVNSTLFAIHNGAKVINMSFGGPAESPSLTSAIQFARDNGVLVVAGSGNDALDLETNQIYPCETNSSNVLCVGAIDPRSNLASFSNYGSTAVDIAAPGASVYSSSPLNTLLYLNEFETGSQFDFIFSNAPGAPSADWGYIDDGSGTNTMLSTHTTGPYQANEMSFANYNGTFDFSSAHSAKISFFVDCTSTDAQIDGQLQPKDGITLEISTDGGINFEEVIRANQSIFSSITPTDKPNQVPYPIGYGLKARHLTDQFTFRLGFFSNNDTTVGSGCTFDNILLVKNGTGSSYNYTNGTSFSSPAVAGLATLIWDFKPSLSMPEVRQIILDSAEVIPQLTEKVASNGMANSYRALALLTDPAPTGVNGTLSPGGDVFAGGTFSSSSSPTINWTAPVGQGIMAGYSYALDAVPDTIVETTELNVELSGLSEGEHTFSIIGINDVGTTGTQVDFSFTVDSITPTAPTGLSVNGGSNQVSGTNESSSSIDVTVSEAGTLSFSFSDGSSPTIEGVASVTSGINSIPNIDLSSLNDGNITLTVFTKDHAENISPNTQLILPKTSTVPDPGGLSINGGTVINASNVSSGTLSFDLNSTGTFSYTFTDSASATIQGTHTISTAGTQSISNLDLSLLQDGTISLSYDFTASGGGTSGNLPQTIEIGTKDTEVSLLKPAQLNQGRLIMDNEASSISLFFSVTETGSLSYIITDTGSGSITGSIPVTNASFGSLNGMISGTGIDLSSLQNGILNVQSSFIDSAGNTSPTMTTTATKSNVSPSLESLLKDLGTFQSASGNEAESDNSKPASSAMRPRRRTKQQAQIAIDPTLSESNQSPESINNQSSTTKPKTESPPSLLQNLSDEGSSEKSIGGNKPTTNKPEPRKTASSNPDLSTIYAQSILKNLR